MGVEWSARFGVGVVSISGAQIACLQAQMPIDLEEKCRGSSVCARPVSDSEGAIECFSIFGLSSEMIGLVLPARGALVVFDHVYRQEMILRIGDFHQYILLAQSWRRRYPSQSCGNIYLVKHLLYTWTQILRMAWFNTIPMESFFILTQSGNKL